MAKTAIYENACMYRLVNGELDICEGKVYESSNGHLHFVTTNGEHRGCSKESGVVSKDCLWLPERNDNLAIVKLLICKTEYIDKLHGKIKEQCNIVEYLRNKPLLELISFYRRFAKNTWSFMRESVNIFDEVGRKVWRNLRFLFLFLN